MTYDVVFAADTEKDFELIFTFLVDSYQEFGDDLETALARAEDRVFAIQRDISRLGLKPHRGTVHNDLLPGLRHVTLGRAIDWIEIDEDVETVRVLAVFFGGQDHSQRMLIRLLGKDEDKT